MRRFALLLRRAAIGATLALVAAAAAAEPVGIDRRATHPDGVSIRLQALDIGEGSIVVSATIANAGEREVRLNHSRSFALDDDAHGVHRLSPPADNLELRIPSRTQVTGELVFIGPLAAAARQLTLSTNRGVGTRDNPHDDEPVLETTLPVEARAAGGGATVSHPNGVALLVRRLATGSAGCVASLVATNGNDRTIVLNQNHGLVLTDEHGVAAPVEAPGENAELVLPPGSRLDAELVFDCHAIDSGGPLTLVTNRGTAGTVDNPYDTVPVMHLKLRPEHGNASAPAVSRAAVAPIERSRLGPPVAIAAAGVPAAAAPAPPRPTTPPAPVSAPTPASPPTTAVGQSVAAAPAPAKPPAPVGLSQLEAALHAEQTDRGLRLVIPADPLFSGQGDTLDDAGQKVLESLAGLAAAMRPREIIVIGHTDSAGEDDANLARSKQRAHAVAEWLAAHAPKEQPHFVEEGFGRTRPVAPNHNADGSDNPEGRAANRRIEILLRRR